MTPTPEQNAKRETPRTDALLAASAGFTDAEQRDILKVGLQQLETELQQLRLAADGMAESLKEARRFLFETPFGGIHRDAILVQINQISKSEAAYRAAGEAQSG